MKDPLKPTHDDVQKQITDWLDIKHVFWYFVPNRGKHVPGVSLKDRCTKGANDLVAIVDGLHIGIEVKTPGDRQSKEQKAFQQAVESAGGTYLLAYDYMDIKPTIERILQGAKPK